MFAAELSKAAPRATQADSAGVEFAVELVPEAASEHSALGTYEITDTVEFLTVVSSLALVLLE